MSGRLWPQNMGVRLRDVPSSGLTFRTDEYNRHKAIYFAIMKLASLVRVTSKMGPVRARAGLPSGANLPALNPDPLERVFPMEGVDEWRPYLSSSSRLLASSDRAFYFSGH
jgi:hypothetical protein